MPRPLIIGVSCVTAVVALLLAWRFSRAAQSGRSAVVRAEGEILRLKTQLGELENARVREERTKAEAKSVTKKPTLKELEAEFAMESRKRNDAYHDKLLATPSLQVLYEQHMHAWYSGLFAAFFRQLKFSPEQQEKFVAALTKWSVQQHDLEAVAKAKGLSRSDPTWTAQRAAAEAELTRETEALLGPAALKMTREYTRLEAARAYVASYAGLLSRLGEPLTIEQTETLTSAFGKASPKKTPDPYRFTSAQWEEVWAVAREILTPQQWREFQTVVPPGQTGGRWEAAVQEILTKTAGPNPTP